MLGRLKSDQGQLFYEFRLRRGSERSSGAEDRCGSRSVLRHRAPFSFEKPQRNRNELGETTVNKAGRKHLP